MTLKDIRIQTPISSESPEMESLRVKMELAALSKKQLVVKPLALTPKPAILKASDAFDIKKIDLEEDEFLTVLERSGPKKYTLTRFLAENFLSTAQDKVYSFTHQYWLNTNDSKIVTVSDSIHSGLDAMAFQQIMEIFTQAAKQADFAISRAFSSEVRKKIEQELSIIPNLTATPAELYAQYSEIFLSTMANDVDNKVMKNLQNKWFHFTSMSALLTSEQFKNGITWQSCVDFVSTYSKIVEALDRPSTAADAAEMLLKMAASSPLISTFATLFSVADPATTLENSNDRRRKLVEKGAMRKTFDVKYGDYDESGTFIEGKAAIRNRMIKGWLFYDDKLVNNDFFSQKPLYSTTSAGDSQLRRTSQNGNHGVQISRTATLATYVSFIKSLSSVPFKEVEIKEYTNTLLQRLFSPSIAVPNLIGAQKEYSDVMASIFSFQDTGESISSHTLQDYFANEHFPTFIEKAILEKVDGISTALYNKISSKSVSPARELEPYNVSLNFYLPAIQLLEEYVNQVIASTVEVLQNPDIIFEDDKAYNYGVYQELTSSLLVDLIIPLSRRYLTNGKADVFTTFVNSMASPFKTERLDFSDSFTMSDSTLQLLRSTAHVTQHSDSYKLDIHDVSPETVFFREAVADVRFEESTLREGNFFGIVDSMNKMFEGYVRRVYTPEEKQNVRDCFNLRMTYDTNVGIEIDQQLLRLSHIYPLSEIKLTGYMNFFRKRWTTKFHHFMTTQERDRYFNLDTFRTEYESKPRHGDNAAGVIVVQGKDVVDREMLKDVISLFEAMPSRDVDVLFNFNSYDGSYVVGDANNALSYMKQFYAPLFTVAYHSQTKSIVTANAGSILLRASLLGGLRNSEFMNVNREKTPQQQAEETQLELDATKAHLEAQNVALELLTASIKDMSAKFAELTETSISNKRPNNKNNNNPKNPNV